MLQNFGTGKYCTTGRNDISYEQMTKVQLYNQAIQGDFQAALAFTKQAAESLPHEVFQLLKEIVQQDCDDYEALKELQYYLGTFYEKGIGKIMNYRITSALMNAITMRWSWGMKKLLKTGCII
ncbi:MAG: hypothetical protein ACLT16_09710 [[Clostridium] innocuum]